jgi:hypothetical protein
MNESKQWEVAMQEVALGIGTKTDLGKPELHLTPAIVWGRMYGNTEPLKAVSLEAIVLRYLELVDLGTLTEIDDVIRYKRMLMMLDAEVVRNMQNPLIALSIAHEKELAVLMYGKYKYSRENWKKINPPVRYLDACGRHLLFHMVRDGVNAIDKESGLPALYHAMCNLSFFGELLTERSMLDGYDIWVKREESHHE